jgi:secreted PhoX family phosphatase
MRHSYLLLFFIITIILGLPSCKKEKSIGTVITDEIVFTHKALKGDILFIGGYHIVTNHNGDTAIAKQNQDFTGYIPINGRSDSGYVIVNHETMQRDPILGDGGGMTVFTVYKNPKTKKWEVVDNEKGKFRNVDFSEVGGTYFNCSGFETGWGTVLTGEETIFDKNEEIYKDGEGISDTSNFIITQFNGQIIQDTVKRFENFNWLVEVDVAQAKAIRKNYNMGRYSHEGGVMLPDGKTVILTDDSTPGFLYKFVAKNSKDLSVGQLYAYQQNR